MRRATATSAAGFALLLSAAVAAQHRPIEVRDVPLASPHALAHFHDALRELAAHRRDRVRVMHWGDSNVAADLWTSVTRTALWRRFGDGGPGYLVPPPFGSRFDGAAILRAGPGWQARRYGFARDFGPSDGLWGLAGVAVEARRGALSVNVPASASGSVVEVHAVGRPAAGAFEVRVDGEHATLVRTARSEIELVRARLALPPGEHRLSVRVRGVRPVRILGVAVEKQAPGVVYDVFGINGHRASAQLEWNETLLRAQLAVRPPDLVVLSYGGNEALDRSLPMERYAGQLRRSVAQMRALAPAASCLVVSPVAMCPLSERNVEVTRIQREVASEAGCAFFDTAEVSGGHGSLCTWIRAGDGLVSGDHLHLGRHGYALVGEQFTDALLAEY